MFGFMGKQDIDKGVMECRATKNGVLVDVRTRDEYRSGHIPGSIHIESGELQKALSIISDKTASLFVYCHSGARSSVAVNTLKKMGYAHVKNIGGIASYKGTVETGENRPNGI